MSFYEKRKNCGRRDNITSTAVVSYSTVSQWKSFLFLINGTTTKAVHFDIWFDSFESECEGLWTKHISNGMGLMSMLFIYSLQHVLINQRCCKYKWIRIHS